MALSATCPLPPVTEGPLGTVEMFTFLLDVVDAVDTSRGTNPMRPRRGPNGEESRILGNEVEWIGAVWHAAMTMPVAL